MAKVTLGRGCAALRQPRRMSRLETPDPIVLSLRRHGPQWVRKKHNFHKKVLSAYPRNIPYRSALDVGVPKATVMIINPKFEVNFEMAPPCPHCPLPTLVVALCFAALATGQIPRSENSVT